MRLVVDVNVVHSSGGIEAFHPFSVKCRHILYTIYENNHKIVISTDLRHECVRHATPYSTIWYYLMKRNNLIEDIKDARNENLRTRILGCFSCVGTRKKVEKDIHLIEAAFKTDKKFISNNSKERKKFKHASLSVTELKTIIWVSTNSYKQLICWLQQGASCNSAPPNWFLKIENE